MDNFFGLEDGSSEEEDNTIDTASASGSSIGAVSEEYETAISLQETEVKNVIKNLIKDSCNYKSSLKHLHKLADCYFGKPSYQDITPTFVDGTPFILDGTSLLTCVMNDSNYDKCYGGQTLHFIYLCERIIEFLCSKGGVCEVVFFSEKSQVWRDIPQFSMTETILQKHLKNNTDINVIEVESIFDSNFTGYVDKVHPCFMMFDFNYVSNVKDLFQSEEKAQLAEVLFKNYTLFALALGIYCIDVNNVELRDNILIGFISRSDALIASIKQYLIKSGKLISKKCMELFKTIKNIDLGGQVLKTNDIKRAVSVYTAKQILTDLHCYRDMAKLFLMYCAIRDTFPLAFRCFTNKKVIEQNLKSVVDNIIIFIDCYLKHKQFDTYDCSSVADLWQGRLFVEFLHCVEEIGGCFSLEGVVDIQYGEYLSELNSITGLSFEKYPVNVSGTLIPFCSNQDSIRSGTVFTEDEEFLPITNAIVSKFCTDVVQGFDTLQAYSDRELENLINKRNTFLAHFNLQNIIPITDEYERINDSNKYDPSWPKAAILNQRMLFARFMDMYGANIEGRMRENKPIICCENKTNVTKKSNEGKKLGKTGLKIQEENRLMMKQKLLDVELTKYNFFEKIYIQNKNSGKSYDTNLSLINNLLPSLTTDTYITKVLVTKIDTLYSMWTEECASKSAENRNLFYLKELFLAIREAACIVKEEQQSLLIEKGTVSEKLGIKFEKGTVSEKLGIKLCQLGFSIIADKCKFISADETLSRYPKKYFANESWARFQLQYLGSDLLREAAGVPDNRVEGFIPDDWQKKLFDIVDKKESALIVAPTSSGKTYASYYCMKKVLEETDDGRVVYVAPTKALVNQVAATVYSRFKRKTLKEGMSVYGIFTRDYRYNALNSQILVTVPECLELLLIAPKAHLWTKKLRYVIFDEIHCLAGQAGSITWERCLMMIQCPFLALSATIQNPEEFQTWMQQSEDYKKELDKSSGTKVHLVVYSERHNDLIKHVYGRDKKIHPIHPYAYLNDRVLHVHEGIPRHIRLAPSEMLELYDAMVTVDQKDPVLKSLKPEVFFDLASGSGFIFRHEVKTYELELRKVLEKWLTHERKKLFNETVNIFQKPLMNHDGFNQNSDYFLENIVDFVNELHCKNMLPAIIFSYNRLYCDMFGKHLAQHFQRLEIESDEKEKKPKKPKKKDNIVYLDDYRDDGQDYDSLANRNGLKSTSKNKEARRYRNEDYDLLPIGLTDCNSKFSLRSMSDFDDKEMQYIERRLKARGFKKTSIEVEMIRRGVGVHHAGVATIIRSTIEMLFRRRMLNVVFATGTLALGIHMPCKTVVVLGDSPYLNTLEFHQISGRAGRRGFDKAGDVIFFGLDSKKMQILQTSKLPKMNGNFPLTVSTVLRFMYLYDKVAEKEIVLNRILVVLNKSLLYQSQPRLKSQMKFFFVFSCQLLIVLGLLDHNGKPGLLSNMANTMCHLHYHEPGNLAFIYLLRTGTLTKICWTKNKTVSADACRNMVILLCHLFTRLPLKEKQLDEKFKNSVVRLPALPSFVNAALQSYNWEVQKVFNNYFKGLSNYMKNTFGNDDTLPLSKKQFKGIATHSDLMIKSADSRLENVLARRSTQNLSCSAFAGLSGNTDNDLYSQDSIISNIRHQVFTDYRVIPLIDLETELNGYAFDFYNHGIVQSIITDNGLRAGEDFKLLLDFKIVLKDLMTSVDELRMSYKGEGKEAFKHDKDLTQCVRNTLRVVYSRYDEFFCKSYLAEKKKYKYSGKK